MNPAIRHIIGSARRKMRLYALMPTNIIGEKLLWKHEKRPMIMVHNDGGLSSQIARATLGKQFEAEGFAVKYELGYYNKPSTIRRVLFHEKRYPYCLDRLFPDLDIQVASAKDILKYTLFYNAEIPVHTLPETIEGWDLRRPVYLSGYSTDYLIDLSKADLYFDIESVGRKIGDNAKKYLDLINKTKSEGRIPVGVHVRRGDMSEAGGYWKVLTGKYFIAAVNSVPDISNCKFFFISNGFDFIKQEVLPYLDCDYTLVENNSYDWEDFFLLSKCTYQIGSQGSWGGLAFRFNKDPGKIFITCHSANTLVDAGDGNVIDIELDEDMYVQ